MLHLNVDTSPAVTAKCRTGGRNTHDTLLDLTMTDWCAAPHPWAACCYGSAGDRKRTEIALCGPERDGTAADSHAIL